LHCKPEWSIQPGEIVRSQALGLSLTQAEPGHSSTILDLIVERHGISFDMDPTGQLLQGFADGGIDQLSRVQCNTGSQKFVPAVYLLELSPYPTPQSARRELLQSSGRSAPQLIQLR
jgi:hypothetical protein